jgi:hypothetical protein
VISQSQLCAVQSTLTFWSHISETSCFSTHFISFLRMHRCMLDNPCQTEIKYLDSAIQSEPDIVGLQIPMQYHAIRNCFFVTIRHGSCNRPSTIQNISIGKWFLSPESASPVAYSSVITEHLRQGTTIKSLEHHETDTLGC